jgi:FlgN protein
MKNNDLLVLLKHQAENLNALLKTILKKQKAIVSNNVIEIEKVTTEEERLLSAVNNAEKERIEFLNDYYMQNSIDASSFTIEDYLKTVAKNLDIQLQKEFLRFRNIIKETTKEIITINKQNKYLIIHSRELLNDIVSAIFSERKNSLLDRKV